MSYSEFMTGEENAQAPCEVASKTLQIAFIQDSRS